MMCFVVTCYWLFLANSLLVSFFFLQLVTGLPKTRSGKIMRRILRKIAHNLYEQLGDVSTLANPSVVEDIMQKWLKQAESPEEQAAAD